MNSHDGPTGPFRRGGAPPASGVGGRTLWPQIRAAAAHIADRIAEAAAEDLRARYELGRLVHRLRYDSSDRQAMRVISKLGLASGLAAATLRRYARVTEMIKPVEFDELTRARGPRGPSLTWSHIEELAEARNTEVRRRCAEAAVNESLSVSALRALVRAASAGDAACQRGTIDGESPSGR
jgi:hypothetical protein